MCGAVLTWCSDPLVLVTTCEESLVTSPVLLTAPSRSTHYTDSSHCRREQLPPPAWPRPSQHGVDCGVSRSEEAGTITVTCHPVTCTQHTPPLLYTRGTRGTRGARGGRPQTSHSPQLWPGLGMRAGLVCQVSPGNG